MENTNPQNVNVQVQRFTLASVLWFKFLRWVDRTSARHLWHTFLVFLSFLAIVAGIAAPSFVLGVLSSTFLNWKAAAIGSVAILYLYGRVLLRVGRKGAAKARRGNQHTWHGVPVPELADYLLKEQSFKTDAIQTLGLSQKQWRRMAGILEERGILTRGENHARVLRAITREQLVEQLTKDFPLVWSEGHEGGGWVLRDGPWRTWLGDEERREQEHKDAVAKLERKKKKLQRDIRELTPAPFTHRVVAGIV